MGNSRGLSIPSQLLKQVGLEEQAEILVEGNTLVLRRPKKRVRSGWAEVTKRIAALGEDALVMPEFANEADVDWNW